MQFQIGIHKQESDRKFGKLMQILPKYQSKCNI
jgi:hypothetical protein